MTDLMQHAMNLMGHCDVAIPRWKMRICLALKRGHPATIIEWRGCMADVRHVDYIGTIKRVANYKERYSKADNIECLVLQKPDGTEDWQPIDRVRFIGSPWRGEVEVWI
jgi:hypothetical protein